MNLETSVELEKKMDEGVLTPFIPAGLRHIRYEETKSSIVGPTSGLRQTVYSFTNSLGDTFRLRRSFGGLPAETPGYFIWLEADFPETDRIKIGIDPAYVFERTGCLVTPTILNWKQTELVPFAQLCDMAIEEMAQLAGIEPRQFVTDLDTLPQLFTDHISLDIDHQCRLLIIAEREQITQIENHIRDHCEQYWANRDWYGARVGVSFELYLQPRKSTWAEYELSEIKVGDLIGLMGAGLSSGEYSITSTIRTKKADGSWCGYEAFLKMNENNSYIEYGRTDMNSPQTMATDAIGAHEEIELQLYAGKTKLPFSDLCTLQEGTLLELQNHDLPRVVLMVQGTPILEGELVYFQDQIMVQITRRID